MGTLGMALLLRRLILLLLVFPPSDGVSQSSSSLWQIELRDEKWRPGGNVMRREPDCGGGGRHRVEAGTRSGTPRRSWLWFWSQTTSESQSDGGRGAERGMSRWMRVPGIHWQAAASAVRAHVSSHRRELTDDKVTASRGCGGGEIAGEEEGKLEGLAGRSSVSGAESRTRDARLLPVSADDKQRNGGVEAEGTDQQQQVLVESAGKLSDCNFPSSSRKGMGNSSDGCLHMLRTTTKKERGAEIKFMEEWQSDPISRSVRMAAVSKNSRRRNRRSGLRRLQAREQQQQGREFEGEITRVSNEAALLDALMSPVGAIKPSITVILTTDVSFRGFNRPLVLNIEANVTLKGDCGDRRCVIDGATDMLRCWIHDGQLGWGSLAMYNIEFRSVCLQFNNSRIELHNCVFGMGSELSMAYPPLIAGDGDGDGDEDDHLEALYPRRSVVIDRCYFAEIKRGLQLIELPPSVCISRSVFFSPNWETSLTVSSTGVGQQKSLRFIDCEFGRVDASGMLKTGNVKLSLNPVSRSSSPSSSSSSSSSPSRPSLSMPSLTGFRGTGGGGSDGDGDGAVASKPGPSMAARNTTISFINCTFYKVLGNISVIAMEVDPIWMPSALDGVLCHRVRFCGVKFRQMPAAAVGDGDDGYQASSSSPDDVDMDVDLFNPNRTVDILQCVSGGYGAIMTDNIVRKRVRRAGVAQPIVNVDSSPDACAECSGLGSSVCNGTRIPIDPTAARLPLDPPQVMPSPGGDPGSQSIPPTSAQLRVPDDTANGGGVGIKHKRAVEWVLPVAISVPTGSVLLMVAVALAALSFRRRGSLLSRIFCGTNFKAGGKVPQGVQRLRSFSYKELSEATNGFATVIGQGGSGVVYRATLKDGEVAAIKSLKREQWRSERDFLHEVDCLGRIAHRNLVMLLGFCNERQRYFLIYEFVPNGTLRDHLDSKSPSSFSSSSSSSSLNSAAAANAVPAPAPAPAAAAASRRPCSSSRHPLAGRNEKSRGDCLRGGDRPSPRPLDWPTRVRIAHEIAMALEYLHHSLNPPLVHRDIKPENVLLQEDFSPKVADFGLCRKINPQGNNLLTVPAGTVGYMAPEIFGGMCVTEKIDVYSYGVLLLEIVTGRRPFAKDFSLIPWVKRLAQDEDSAKAVADPKLRGEFDSHQLYMLTLLARRCLYSKMEQRPTMRVIVRALEGIRGLDNDTGQADVPVEGSPWLSALYVPKSKKNGGSRAGHDDDDDDEDDDDEGYDHKQGWKEGEEGEQEQYEDDEDDEDEVSSQKRRLSAHVRSETDHGLGAVSGSSSADTSTLGGRRGLSMNSLGFSSDPAGALSSRTVELR